MTIMLHHHHPHPPSPASRIKGRVVDTQHIPKYDNRLQRGYMGIRPMETYIKRVLSAIHRPILFVVTAYTTPEAEDDAEIIAEVIAEVANGR